MASLLSFERRREEQVEKKAERSRGGGELGKHNTAQQLTNETRLIQDTITES